jgi:cob(I)alamin adenosyltransferase
VSLNVLLSLWHESNQPTSVIDFESEIFMKIYTGFGDKGRTRLFGGDIVDKDHLRIQVYGTLDEFNSVLGVALTFGPDEPLDKQLIEIQNDIFRISAILAAPDEKNRRKLGNSVDQNDVKKLEHWIDTLDEQLIPLQNFVLPGGSKFAAYLHLARTTCRRAERHLVTLSKSETVNEHIEIYLNRLSDLLFVMARFANKQAQVGDVLWLNS